jgi:Arc/MetJ-type ribon-helix-helix transcriptional regulator
MSRITISLPTEVAARVKREAHRRRTSVSEVIREALVRQLEPFTDERRSVPFANLGRSGKKFTARNADQILKREWSDARRR